MKIKSIAVAMTLSIAAATPGLAAKGRQHHQQRQPSNASVGDQNSTLFNEDDPTVVRSYGGRRIIGRDPDPNIRQSLRSEDAIFRHEN